MKKNKMMRLASLLLVMCLLTTSVISGTFAKYTTSVSSDDSARVARWGFNTAEINFEDLFAASYTNVAAGDDTTIIAPGTSGRVSFEFENTMDAGPEVAYTFNVDATTGSSIHDDIVANDNIKWALINENETEQDAVWGTFSALQTKIEALDGSSDGAKEYGALAIPAMVDTEYTILWKWEFVTNEDDATNADAAAKNDSWLGNQAAPDNVLGVTLKVTITATQVG